MVVNFEQVDTKGNHSFLLRYNKVPLDEIMPLHQHPEFELAYVIEGCGHRIIGEYVELFSEGDLIFIPPNIPHCWLYDTKLLNTQYAARSIVVQFQANLLNENVSFLPELAPILEKLSRIQQALRIEGKSGEYIRSRLNVMLDENNFKQLISFLEILFELSISDGVKPINQIHLYPKKPHSDMQQIQKVYAYVIENYACKITLSDVASIVAMSEASFCSFFKRINHKPFTVFLNEYRINIACQLLKSDIQSISEIGYSVGFFDIPHFNRTFKKMMNITPLKYRQSIYQIKYNN